MKRLPLLACLATAVLLSAVVHSQNDGAPIEPLLKNLTPPPIPPPERMTAPDAFADAPAAPEAPETPQPAGEVATPAPAPKAVIAAPAPEIATPAPEIATPAPEIATQPARVTVATESDELPVGVTETPDGLISVRFEELPMSEVIKLFSQISGANIIAATTNLNGTVTASLKNVGWKPAFESILSRHSLLLNEKPLGSGIYVVESGIPGQEPLITETLQLRFAKVEQMTGIINSMLEKKGKATAYSEGNAILLQAPASKITEIQRIVKILDRPRSQVYIEARFVEMTAAASKKLGLKWDPLDGMSVGVKEVGGGFSATQGKLAQYLTGVNDFVDTDGLDTTPKVPISTLLLAKDLTGAGGMSADEVQWKRMRGIKGQISASDFSLVMSAFEKEDGVSTISNPKIIVANEETAIVDMTTKEPYVLVESQRNTSGDGLTTQDTNTKLGIIPGSSDGPSSGEAFFSYGVTLKVRPRVSSSGVITVVIEPSISSRDLSQGIDGYYVVSGNEDTPSTKYPIISIKKIRTTFSMLDGSTAVIGGLTRSSEANIDSGIPLLREIPWIGPRLFGWKSRAKDQREIVIFVTIGIINPEEAMPENIGMPKNAVLTRDFQEPGDRPREDLMRLKK